MRLSELDAVWARAQSPTLRVHRIRSDEIRATRSACIKLATQDTDATSPIVRLSAWRIFETVSTTILPFEHCSLQIQTNLESIAKNARGVMSSSMDELTLAVDKLFSLRENPKKTALDDIFLEAKGRISIWNKPRNQRALGWPPAADKLLATEYGDSVSALSGLRATQESSETLVVISPLDPRYFDRSMMFRIYGRGITQTVHILAYGDEPEVDLDLSVGSMPHGISLLHRCQGWKVEQIVVNGIPSTDAMEIVADSEMAASSEISAELKYLDWESDIFATSTSDEDLAPSVLLEFVGGRSALVFTTSRLPLIDGASYSYQDPEDLDEGDIIAFLSGDSDDAAVHQRADQILRSKGHERSALLALTKKWKQVMRTCIATHGQSDFQREVSKLTGRMTSLARLDAWSRQEVLAPQSFDTFLALLTCTKSMGFFRDISDIHRHAADCWAAVEQLRNSSREGGRQLSESRIDTLEEWLSRGPRAPGETSPLDGTGATAEILQVRLVRYVGDQPKSKIGRLINRGSGNGFSHSE